MSASIRVSLIVQCTLSILPCLYRESVAIVLGGLDVRNFLTLSRHDSCIGACLVESGCSTFLIHSFRYHLGASFSSCSCFLFYFYHQRFSWVYLRVFFAFIYPPSFLVVTSFPVSACSLCRFLVVMSFPISACALCRAVLAAP